MALSKFVKDFIHCNEVSPGLTLLRSRSMLISISVTKCSLALITGVSQYRQLTSPEVHDLEALNCGLELGIF